MRVRQYKMLVDDNVACPLCQSIVSKVNMNSHKKARKCEQLRDGYTADNYRKTVQTVKIFDGVNAEPGIVKYDIYTYGPDDPGIKDYDIVRVMKKDEPPVGSAASAAAVGAGLDDADDDANDDDTDADDSDADAFSAAAACAGVQSM